MSAIYMIAVLLFMNGSLIEEPHTWYGDEDHRFTKQNCPDYARQLVDMYREHYNSDVQVVTKCIDLAQQPLTLSAFGSQAK